jgi:hypothetical protein
MMKTEITADEIVSLLHSLGYRASYELNDINLIVSSASQGFDWYIHISVTEESEASDFLIFSHTRLVSPVLFPVGKICNQFNIISPNGVATFRMDDNHDLTEDVMISLDFSVSLTGGVADECRGSNPPRRPAWIRPSWPKRACRPASRHRGPMAFSTSWR